MKNNIYNWIWKWHFIGGIISLPFVVILAITGSVYLFKSDYEKVEFEKITTINPTTQEPLSYQKQWEIVKNTWNKAPDALLLNHTNNRATQFTSGMFSHKSSFFVDPYSGNETGRITLNETDMHKIRKLHGELLLGSFGTKIVELVASWMVVLLITGIYLFWPREKGLKGLFQLRTNQSRRIFYRDLHAVSGFWFSLLLLLILAGGLPWTDIFGSGYKWIQESTNAGFPSTWSARNAHSTTQGISLPLDVFVKKAHEMKLSGEVSIQLPKSAKGVFSISNQTTEFDKMRMFHFDQYTGELLKSHTWEDIGLMMKTRLWVMAFHQGQFGTWNFILVLLIALALLVLSLSALISYLKRKTKGSWSIPNSPQNMRIGTGLCTL